MRHCLHGRELPFPAFKYGPLVTRPLGNRAVAAVDLPVRVTPIVTIGVPRSTRRRKRNGFELFDTNPIGSMRYAARLRGRSPDRERSAMRKWYGNGLFALACLTLTGCAEQRAALSPADAVAQLRTGTPLLQCREACVAGWRGAQPQAAQLDAAARWPELAVLVIGIGYQDDLSLYYLGRAAEGLGYPGAAASYYRQSTHVSGTSLSCQQRSGVCGGLILPRAALSRIAAIERELDRARPRRAGPAPGAAPRDATPGDTGPQLPGQPEPAPATAYVPPPAEIVPPGPSRTGPAASEYIEPPPAR